MGVDLRPVDEMEIDPEVLDFVAEAYCANCTHVDMEGSGDPYCTRWEEPTRIESGWICPEYSPQGFDRG